MAHIRQSRPDSDRIAPGGLQETSAALEKVTVDAGMVPASRLIEKMDQQSIYD